MIEDYVEPSPLSPNCVNSLPPSKDPVSLIRLDLFQNGRVCGAQDTTAPPATLTNDVLHRSSLDARLPIVYVVERHCPHVQEQ